MNYFFIDAETDGLYGRFLSVAVLVTDECGNETEHFYGSVKIEEDTVQSAWVKENVLPHLKNAEVTFETEYDLLEAVWQLWIKHREDSYAVSDVMYPVESRLFIECVKHNIKEREFLAPFPLLDLSTLLAARGFQWDADRQALSGMETVPHDALNDVKMMAKTWHKIFRG